MVFIVVDFLLAKANHGLNVLDNVANAFSLYNNDPAGENWEESGYVLYQSYNIANYVHGNSFCIK